MMDELRPQEGDPEPFSAMVHRQGDDVRVAVAGELDLATAPELDVALRDAIAGGARRVLLDLRALKFIDSTGIGLIYRFVQLSRNDGFTAAIVRAPDGVQRVFAIAGLDLRLPFTDDPH